MGDDDQSLLTEQDGIDKKKFIKNLYIDASFFSKFFGCWAGTYSRWVSINNGLYDSTNVAHIEKSNTTEVLTEFIDDKVNNIYGDS